jgi:hypothetical protein
MSLKLTDVIVKALVPPAAGNKITYDTVVKGFGARITSAGAISFVEQARRRRNARFPSDHRPHSGTSVAGDLPCRKDRNNAYPRSAAFLRQRLTAGAILSGKKSAKVLPMRGRR